MIERILTFLFPPRLPGHIPDWDDRSLLEPDISVCPQEQGTCGPAARKKYRNGIERHFAEQESQS